jgi:hypothetical protein
MTRRHRVRRCPKRAPRPKRAIDDDVLYGIRIVKDFMAWSELPLPQPTHTSTESCLSSASIVRCARNAAFHSGLMVRRYGPVAPGWRQQAMVQWVQDHSPLTERPPAAASTPAASGDDKDKSAGAAVVSSAGKLQESDLFARYEVRESDIKLFGDAEFEAAVRRNDEIEEEQKRVAAIIEMKAQRRRAKRARLKAKKKPRGSRSSSSSDVKMGQDQAGETEGVVTSGNPKAEESYIKSNRMEYSKGDDSSMCAAAIPAAMRSPVFPQMPYDTAVGFLDAPPELPVPETDGVPNVSYASKSKAKAHKAPTGAAAAVHTASAPETAAPPPELTLTLRPRSAVAAVKEAAANTSAEEAPIAAPTPNPMSDANSAPITDSKSAAGDRPASNSEPAVVAPRKYKTVVPSISHEERDEFKWAASDWNALENATRNRIIRRNLFNTCRMFVGMPLEGFYYLRQFLVDEMVPESD